jgi:N-acetylmuramic acid 6-phosphate etherase
MKDFRTTEAPSRHNDLETWSTKDLLHGMNQEDQTVAVAVEKALPAVEKLVDALLPVLQSGGRLFYIGAGTSGRLGILDASECPPTFGIPHGVVIGLIAGGDSAIRKAVEFAEDDVDQAWKDLSAHGINPKDAVVGIAASGTTPYVLGGVRSAKEAGCLTGAIVCNAESPLAEAVDFPVEVVVGPEFVTGSTRMKSGTAQKLVLNMLTTALMIRWGKVRGNRMVDMQMSNAKLVKRGIRILMEMGPMKEEQAARYLEQTGSVRAALDAFNSDQKKE